MVQETNRYASTCLGDISETWTAVTTNEVCAYMGCMILMGFIKLPSLRNYCKNRVFCYTTIADMISRDQFLANHHYLHFINNETLSTLGSVDHDKLGKIRLISTALSEQFRAIYEPGKNISIDEAMIPFKHCTTWNFLASIVYRERYSKNLCISSIAQQYEGRLYKKVCH